MQINSFTEIEAWQLARELTSEIYKLTNEEDFKQDYGLRDQIRRASVSIMSNIAEGFERSGNREFIQFLSHAKGSAGEVRAQLFVALDAGYIEDDKFKVLDSKLDDISQKIGGFIQYLKKSSKKGTKFD